MRETAHDERETRTPRDVENFKHSRRGPILRGPITPLEKAPRAALQYKHWGRKVYLALDGADLTRRNMEVRSLTNALEKARLRRRHPHLPATFQP